MRLKFIVSDDPEAVNSITARNKHMQKILASYLRLASPGTDMPAGFGSRNFVTDPTCNVIENAMEDALDVQNKLHCNDGTKSFMCTATTCSFTMNLPIIRMSTLCGAAVR